MDDDDDGGGDRRRESIMGFEAVELGLVALEKREGRRSICFVLDWESERGQSSI